MKAFENCCLGDVLSLKNGYAFKSSTYLDKGIPVIRISDINNGYVTIEDAVRVEKMPLGFEFLVSKGDILIAMSGATTGKFGLYEKDEIVYQNQRVGNLKIFSDKLCNKKFIYYSLFSKRRNIEKAAYGGAQPNISGEKIENIRINIFPFAEQNQIVAIIEELISDLDNAMENFKKAQEQLKVYRRAVLSWAFGGKATSDLENWRQTTLGEIISISSGDGLTKAKRNDEGQYLVYGGNGITGNHSEYLFEQEKLIIGRVGAHCGNAHITKPYSWVTDNAFVVTFDEKLFDINYLHYLIISLNLNKYSSSTAQPVISQGKVYPIQVIVPIKKEDQQSIVSEIASRLSICDKTEELIIENLQRAEALRQSILKQAFEGKLTEKWRRDHKELIFGENSAEKLLERIKEAKENLKGRKK